MDNTVSGLLDDNTIVLYGSIRGSANLYGGVVNDISCQLLGSMYDYVGLTGNVVASYDRGTYEKYEGSYKVTPMVTSQTLATENRLMKENVTIKEIPFYEVSNSFGGDTIVIGSEL